MQKILSIWLVPAKEDEEYLSNIIKKLATENNSPDFTPHLTLFGEAPVSLEELKNIINDVFANQIPFKVKTTGINQSDNFWKTVFVEFELNETLKNLFEKVSEKTDKRNLDTFKPHISLIYKTIPEEERIKIMNSLKIDRDEITIDRVFINTPKPGDTDFSDVEHHQQPYKKDLK